MYLGSPLLPITISAQKATQDLKEALEKKNWIDFEIVKETLILVPYFLYNYHYYVEQHKEGAQIIKEAFDGVLAIDGHSIKIEEDKVDLIKYSWNKAGQITPKETFDEKWNNIDKKEQHEIIKLKTAEYFDVPKSNVIVTAIRKVLVPFYVFKVTVGDAEFKVQKNAVDGAFYGLKEIPMREKSTIEITRETINELKDPKAWIKYTKEMMGGTLTAGKKAVSASKNNKSNKTETAKQTIDFSFFAKPEILIIIMLLALLLIYLALFL